MVLFIIQTIEHYWVNTSMFRQISDSIDDLDKQRSNLLQECAQFKNLIEINPFRRMRSQVAFVTPTL